jgi:hypothetical protein
MPLEELSTIHTIPKETKLIETVQFEIEEYFKFYGSKYET